MAAFPYHTLHEAKSQCFINSSHSYDCGEVLKLRRTVMGKSGIIYAGHASKGWARRVELWGRSLTAALRPS